jgi:hypothetical protein
MAEKSHPSGPNPEGSRRIVWREQGLQRRAYGDFSDFSDVGGARDEPLMGPGMQAATSDPGSAQVRAIERLNELCQLRQMRRTEGSLGM